jgi:hypothetical protein
MLIAEKVVHSTPFEVRLHKEGVFWIAYEQSAYITSQVKSLKPTRKYIKKLGREIVSVGFPDTVLEKIILRFTLKERNETHVVLETESPFDEVAYNEWKAGIRTTATAVQPVRPPEKDYSVTDRLLAFDIGNSTPIQCVMFLNELQQSVIKGNNGAL